MTRDEVNRKLAEWLGYRFNEATRDFYGHDRFWLGKADSFEDALTKYEIDFYTDEAANAMLLDALKRPYPYFSICFNTERSKTEFEGSGLSTNRNFCWETPTTDRKAAICEAALQRIEQGEK